MPPVLGSRYAKAGAENPAALTSTTTQISRRNAAWEGVVNFFIALILMVLSATIYREGLNRSSNINAAPWSFVSILGAGNLHL